MKENNHKYNQYIFDASESRWADSDEIKNSMTTKRIDINNDSCKGCGLPLISDGCNVHVDDSDSHTLVFGATGSKKTRIFGMPLVNMFAMAGESFIATDPKGELYSETSGLVEAQGYNLIVLNYRDIKKSSLWNPLAIPYELYHKGEKEEAVALINDFVETLGSEQRNSTADSYWIETASSMIFAYLLFFIDTATEDEANIYNFNNFFIYNSTPCAVLRIALCVAENSIVVANLKSVLAVRHADNTFGCIVSVAAAILRPFITRTSLNQMMSKSSFDFRKVGREKTAIYIIVPDEKTTLHFLVTIFIKQTYEVLINEAQQENNKKLPIRLNFLLDEFGNIPKIPDMASMISAARSRNIRFFLMTQGMFQLKHKYNEDAETIKGNCENIVFLYSREYELLREISILCGETHKFDVCGNVRQQPLISVAELQRLQKEKGEALILHGRNYPFMSRLPDIDEYVFKNYCEIKKNESTLPQIVFYDGKNILEKIKLGEKSLPFSIEVFGKETFISEENRKTIELLEDKSQQ